MKNRLLPLATACAILIVSSAASWAQSNPYAPVNRFLRDQQFPAALSAIEAYLSSNPRDPQMLLLQGVAYRENGQIQEAKGVYLRLTQEFPELPEPHNNLATVYAQESQFSLARESLEMAVKLNPNYALAHENLGDVYVRLARESYARAAALDRTAVTIGPKRVQLESVLRPTAPATTPPKQP